jgi:hypothetical protein
MTRGLGQDVSDLPTSAVPSYYQPLAVLDPTTGLPVATVSPYSGGVEPTAAQVAASAAAVGGAGASTATTVALWLGIGAVVLLVVVAAGRR